MSDYKRRRLSKDERRKILRKTEGHCAYCGCELKYNEMQIDHIVPLHLGGADEISNLYPACRACNHYKSTYTVERFRETVERAYDTQMKCSATFRNLVRFGMIVRPRKDVKFWFERW